MKSPCCLLALLLLAVPVVRGEATHFLLIQPERLAELRAAYRGASADELSPGATRLARQVMMEAEKSLTLPILTITANKNLQASGDPHDYFSTGPYWWPDPSKTNGLPYIRRDGMRNPERNKISDQPVFLKMIQAVESLSLAYGISGDEKYAEQATRLLRGFFLDPKTRMNPNLNYGQAIPGLVSGRGNGVIDTIYLIKIPDILSLIQGSPSWSAKDRKEMTDWFKTFSLWLERSKNGREEKMASNNHGIAYDLQLSGVLAAAGYEKKARSVLGSSLPRRMDAQIMADGKQPKELERTNSWDYSSFNLRNLCKAATIAQSLGIDLWNHKSRDGRGSMKLAMLYLVPFLNHPKDWKTSQILPFHTSEARVWLGMGSAIYGDTPIRTAQRDYAPLKNQNLQDWLMIPLQHSGVPGVHQ